VAHFYPAPLLVLRPPEHAQAAGDLRHAVRGLLNAVSWAKRTRDGKHLRNMRRSRLSAHLHNEERARQEHADGNHLLR
jgi:hypothetical protein